MQCDAARARAAAALINLPIREAPLVRRPVGPLASSA
jgi:hypothetical protein